jgi:hypothetical protein
VLTTDLQQAHLRSCGGNVGGLAGRVELNGIAIYGRDYRYASLVVFRKKPAFLLDDHTINAQGDFVSFGVYALGIRRGRDPNYFESVIAVLGSRRETRRDNEKQSYCARPVFHFVLLHAPATIDNRSRHFHRTFDRTVPAQAKRSGLGIRLSCNEPGSCPREIGAGLLYSLLKSSMANKLYLNATIEHQVNRLVNTFFQLISYFLTYGTIG